MYVEYKKLDYKKLELIYKGKKSIIVVRNIIPKLDFKISDSNIIDTTLNLMGLEKVPYKDLVPCYKHITKNDILITEKEQCCICHDDYKIRQYKRELLCNHIYHKKCIDKWLKNNWSCPICRELIKF